MACGGATRTMPPLAIRSCGCGCRRGQRNGRALGGARSTGAAAAAPASPTGRHNRCSRCRCCRWTQARTRAAEPPRPARPTDRAGPACARSKGRPARRRRRQRRRFSFFLEWSRQSWSAEWQSWPPCSPRRRRRRAGSSRRTTSTRRPTPPPGRVRILAGTPCEVWRDQDEEGPEPAMADR